jgi:hypothetical protein
MRAHDLQPSETPMVKTMELPGPSLPTNDGMQPIESLLLVQRLQLANLRHIAAVAGLHVDAQEANAESISAKEVEVDKLLLRSMDVAIKEERLDHALQLISGCACMRAPVVPLPGWISGMATGHMGHAWEYHGRCSFGLRLAAWSHVSHVHPYKHWFVTTAFWGCHLSSSRLVSNWAGLPETVLVPVTSCR